MDARKKAAREAITQLADELLMEIADPVTKKLVMWAKDIRAANQDELLEYVKGDKNLDDAPIHPIATLQAKSLLVLLLQNPEAVLKVVTLLFQHHRKHGTTPVTLPEKFQ